MESETGLVEGMVVKNQCEEPGCSKAARHFRKRDLKRVCAGHLERRDMGRYAYSQNCNAMREYERRTGKDGRFLVWKK